MFGFIFFSLFFFSKKNSEKEQYNLKIINANEKTISNNHYG